MPRNFSYFFCFLGATLLLFSACEEQRRMIIPQNPGGDKGERVVLLEEFTGKGCTNCPKGSREIENLLALYPNNLVVVSIHAGLFADPAIFDVGEYDLRTDEGEQLYDYLGPIIGYPTGVVNRREFNSDLQHSSNAWGAYILEEFEDDPLADFTIENIYNPGNRLLITQVEGEALTAISGDIRISVMLTENGIVDAQDDQEAGGIVDDYVHKHVLRDMATKFDGDPLASQLNEGEHFQESFSLILDEDWVAEACEVVVFISIVDVAGETFRVLQAGQEEVR